MKGGMTLTTQKVLFFSVTTLMGSYSEFIRLTRVYKKSKIHICTSTSRMTVLSFLTT